eukprot:TRINITY_DN5125_c0_g1_i1.p1 TRINITY_DN5125_c0_g1~~TRINITY_DN5125_c0_g1_i1.p1  ORF type:complete len:405 (+),score=73.04 TRINITY_DN5125_c0_g1_i1:227-1441(+)
MVYTGYLPTKDTGRGNTALAFVFLGCKKASGSESGFQNCPTIFWFQGGPGESSFWGNFFGIGPHVGNGTSPFSFYDNPYSWNQNYNLVFIDQPLGAGFSQYDSISDIPTTTEKLTEQLYIAMNEMFTNTNLCIKKFNLLKSGIYLFGQEEAGQAIPELMEAVITKNNTNIKIKGLGIGNSFSDPDNILAYIGMYAYNNGLIDFNERQEIEKYIMTGIIASRSNDWQKVRDMYNTVLVKIEDYSGIPDLNNIRREEEVDYKFNLELYFQSSAIKSSWGFNETEDFEAFSTTCYKSLESSTMIYEQSAISDVLAHYPIMFYNGQYDLEICPPCTETWLNKVVYKDQQKFQDLEFTAVKNSQGAVYAYEKLAGNLEYVIIKGSGQFVPFDQPASALQMVNEFISRHN